MFERNRCHIRIISRYKMSEYGSFDILWLNGGWITGEDIHLDRRLSKARKKHPGLISVDRSIRGKNEITRHQNAVSPKHSLTILGKVVHH